MSDTACQTVTLRSLDEFEKLLSVINEYAEQFSISDGKAFKVTLALDELISNIFNYAFENDDAPEVTVTICIVHGYFFAKVVDCGIPFDASQIDEPELEKPLAERRKPIGGMGIHLVRNMMDSFSYYRHNNCNVVIVCCSIKEDSGE